ncbi:MAG: ParB N-terminal domain-containing protein [Weeksellaceae bacterium]|nr:ParB N-terminal domain-containing protein [Weeksellaceae bacterium]
MTNPVFQNIELALLDLDSNNPRLPKSYHGSKEEKILEYMLLDGSLIELMLAIGKNGFFAGEQLLVVKSKKKYKVIEGNRRLSAVKLLNNPALATVQKSKIKQVLEETTQRPTKIPCLIFNDEKEIHDYLGYRHITGIKEWKLLEKAKYLYDLYNNNYKNKDFYNSCKELAKSIGSRRDYVERLIIGYSLFKIIEDNAFFKIKNLDDTTFYFNYIADSLSRENIINFLGVSIDDKNGLQIDKVLIDNLKLWVQWFFEKNQEGSTRLIGDSKTLTLLNKVLGDDKAKEAFVKKSLSLQDSIELTDESDVQFITYLNNSIKQLEKADMLSLKVSFTYDLIKDYLNQNNSLLKKIADSIKTKELSGDEF